MHGRRRERGRSTSECARAGPRPRTPWARTGQRPRTPWARAAAVGLGARRAALRGLTALWGLAALRGLTALRGLAALLALALAGCGGCGQGAGPDAAVDGGVDAGRDQGVDLGVDLGRDAGRDLGARDLGGDRDGGDGGREDGAVDGGDGDAGATGWTVLPEAAPECPIALADDPRAVYVPDWQPCPAEMPAGCERLVMPVGAVSGIAITSDGEPRVFLVLPPPAGYDRMMAGVGRTAALWALASPGGRLHCATRWEGWGAGRTVMLTSHDVDADRYEERAYPLGDDGSVAAPLWTVRRVKGTSMTSVHVGEATVAGNIDPGLPLEVWESGRVHRVQVRGEDPSTAFLVGRDVLFESWGAGDRVRVFHATVDEGPTLLYATPDGSDLKGFATDGRDMAWTQSYGPDAWGLVFERTELWASPYATRAEDVRPRRVAVLERQPVYAAVGDGWYVLPARDGRSMDLVRLSDGHRKRLGPPPDGFAYDRLPAVGGGHLLLPARRERPRFEATVYRVPLDAIPGP
jgi:hypothetical protein